MANGVEEFNPLVNAARLASGFKLSSNMEASKPPSIRFVDGLGENYKKIGMQQEARSIPILDSWVTRYPNAKLGK
jgi:hypothetical protein